MRDMRDQSQTLLQCGDKYLTNVLKYKYKYFTFKST